MNRTEQSAGRDELTASSSFRTLVDVWLADLDLEDKLAPSTRALYERNMRQLVLPAFENYPLREITVRKVDQFIKTLAATKSYSTAKQAKTVLSLAFGLAVRYDALRENPVRDIARLRKPPSQAMALTIEQVEAIRAAVRGWRRGPGFVGPPPDGQLEQIIEVMLGTSARIGEVLGDPQVRRRRHRHPGDGADLRDHRVAGRQADASTAPPEDAEVDSAWSRSRRSPPRCFASDSLSWRSETPDHLLFFSRNRTPLTTNNVRRRLRSSPRARRASPASRLTRSDEPSPRCSTGRAVRTWLPRCSVTPRRRSPSSTTSSPTRR